MSSGHKTLTTFLTALTGLILTILGLALHWQLWVWASIAVLLPTVSWWAGRATAPKREAIPREYTLEPDLPLPFVERRERVVTDVALPSCADDYDVLFSATVRWCPTEAPVDAPEISAAGLAVSAVLDRARRITAQHAPDRCSLVQHQLNGALGSMESDPSGRILAMADNVTLSLSETDASRLSRLATVRKDEALWQHERKYECDRRAYLGDDVLKDTGSAVVWWLAKNDDHIKKTVDDIGVLAQLSSAANNEEIPENLRHMVPYPVPAPVPDEPQPASPELNGLFTGTVPPMNGESGTPASAADHFGEMLARLGLTPDDHQSALLARTVANATMATAPPEEIENLIEQFDKPRDRPGTAEEDEPTSEDGEKAGEPES